MSRLHEAEEKLIHDGNLEAAETLETFEARWRYAVFPAMIAFIILAAFGFYLIYGMLKRMEDLSANVNRMTEVIAVTLPAMQKNINMISDDVNKMSGTIQGSFPGIDKNVSTMSKEMKTLSYSTNSMAATTQSMGSDLWEMNRNISKPLALMNKMIPWSPRNNNTNIPAMTYYPAY